MHLKVAGYIHHKVSNQNEKSHLIEKNAKLKSLLIPYIRKSDSRKPVRWYQRTMELLRPLYSLIAAEVFCNDYVQVGESKVPIINNDTHQQTRNICG